MHPNSSSDKYRSDYFKVQADVDKYYSDLLLFDWMPKIDSQSTPIKISMGSGINSSGEVKSTIGVSYNATFGYISISFNDLDSTQGVFSAKFNWDAPYVNNVEYNEQETVNSWGYILQLKNGFAVDDNLRLRFWTERTEVGFVRDGLWANNDEANKTLTNSLHIYFPDRDIFGVVQ